MSLVTGLFFLLLLLNQRWSPPLRLQVAHCSTFRIVCDIIIIIIIDMNVSCHRPFLPGTSLEPAVIPTAQASSFTLQYFPYYVWCYYYYYYYFYFFFLLAVQPFIFRFLCSDSICVSPNLCKIYNRNLSTAWRGCRREQSRELKYIVSPAVNKAVNFVKPIPEDEKGGGGQRILYIKTNLTSAFLNYQHMLCYSEEDGRSHSERLN